MLRIPEFTVVLMILIVLSTIVAPVTGVEYPVLLNKYHVHIGFQNFRLAVDDKVIVLNGELEGVTLVKYVFREEFIIVSVKYLDYRLKGVIDPDSRRALQHLLSKTAYYRFNYSEPPYSEDQPFMIKGGVKYYVSPQYLPLSGLIEQYVMYPLGNGSYIREDRIFIYDYATGILLKTMVNSTALVNTTLIRYSLDLRLIDSSRSELLVKNIDIKYLLAPTLLVFTILYILLSYGKNRFRTIDTTS